MSTNATTAISIMAKSIAARNQVISIKPNSIFSLLDLNNTNEQVNDVAQRISNKINAELILVKNKLNPLMIEISKLMEEKITQYKEDSELSKYSIVPYNLPAIVEELKSLKIITTRRVPLSIGLSNLYIPAPTIEEVRTIFRHSNTIVNSYSEDILCKYSDQDLLNLWDKYLSSISEANPNIRDMGMHANDIISDLILLVIALDKLSTYKPVGVNVDDNKYYEMINLYTAEVCNFISIVDDNFKLFRKTGKLIINIQDTVAKVDAVLYDQFIEKGGTPEAILGLIISNKRELSNFLMVDIEANKDYYVGLWNDKVKLHNFTSVSKEINKMRTIYSMILPEVMDKYIPADLEEILTVDYNTAVTRLDAVLNQATTSEVLDYKYVARKMVGIVLFPETNYDYFSSNMVDYYKLNPDITPRDASTFASIDFVVDFMLDQLELGDINGSSSNTTL